jgi:hypothetical protein
MSNQFHSFHTINVNQENKTRQFQQNVYCPFPVKKIEFDFAYNILSDAAFPSYILTADICNNEVVGVLNKYVGSGVLTAEITQADFKSAGISNVGYVDLPGNLIVDFDLIGILTPGLDPSSIPVITPTDWAAAEVKTSDPISCNNNIRVRNNNPVNADPYIFRMRQTSLTGYRNGYIYITPAQLLTAAIVATNNPLTTINNIACTRQYIDDGTTFTTGVRVLIADFNNRLIPNSPQIVDINNGPINISLINTFSGSPSYIPGKTRAYISNAQFIAANINSTNNPLVVAATIPCTIDGNSLTLTLTKAEFDAANIPNTNNPLETPQALDILINGAASYNTITAMDGLSRDKSIDYYYKDPIRVNTVNYRIESGVSNIIGGDILCHVTCYG